MPRRVESTTLFDIGPELPDGFIYRADFISADEEAHILEWIGRLQFSDVLMHGVVARRRIVQYGHNYSFDSARISAGAQIPEFLRPLRDRVAVVAGRRPEEFSELLVTEYPAGAPIGWHRDAPAFDVVAGVSLLSACRFQLRRYDRSGSTLTLELQPRSLYVMAGPARTDWQHHIPPTPALRYSITMRTLRARRR